MIKLLNSIPAPDVPSFVERTLLFTGSAWEIMVGIALWMVMFTLTVAFMRWVYKQNKAFFSGVKTLLLKPVRFITGKKPAKSELSMKEAYLINKITKKENKAINALIMEQNRTNPAVKSVAKTEKAKLNLIAQKKSYKASKKG